MPYMLLAFIHDALLTTLIYLKLLLFIVCIYLMCLGICHLNKFKNLKANNKHVKFLDYLLYSCMVWAIGFSLVMFLFVVIYIITLGTFDDFKNLKYLTPSLPLAVVTLFLLKPACTFISNKNREASNIDDRKAEEGQGMGNNNDHRTHPNTTESSF